MQDSQYDLSTSDLLLYQELILWALQWKRNGIELPDARKRRLLDVVELIDRIVVNRAAAGDMASMAGAAEVLVRKPVTSEVHRQQGQQENKKTGSK